MRTTTIFSILAIAFTATLPAASAVSTGVYVDFITEEETEGTRRPIGGSGGGLTGLRRRFQQSPAGGKVPVPDLEEIRRRMALRGGARWRQMRLPGMDRMKAPELDSVRRFQRQRQRRLF